MAAKGNRQKRNISINEIMLLLGDSLSDGDEFGEENESVFGSQVDSIFEVQPVVQLDLLPETLPTCEPHPDVADTTIVDDHTGEEDCLEEESQISHPGVDFDVPDDSDRDPDYLTEGSASSKSEDVHEPKADGRDWEEGDIVEENNNANKTKRQRRPFPNDWKQNVSKAKRLKGEQHKNKKGKEIEEKKIGLPCASDYCRKLKDRGCQTLSEEQRRGIFQSFWSMNTWEERRLYVRTLVTKVNIKQKKAVPESRRQSSFAYSLKLQDGSSFKVCKKLFASTLGMSERTIRLWLNDCQIGNQVEKTKTGPKSGKCSKITEAEEDFLSAWLDGLPTVDSHYCRNTPTYREKKFLYPGTTKAQLHREYKEAAEAAGVRAVSITYLSQVFDEKKYSVFIPRKDQCDVCVSFKQGNINKDEYDMHIKMKEEARAEKARDKESASAKKAVWTMDLQAVLLCPKTKASCLYYKTKLQVHNFTLFDLQSKEGFCYLWNETEGGLGSEIFASLQYCHFERLITNNPQLEEIIIWSDGCGYQNRNATVSNAYLDLAKKYDIIITQKFLVAGHTQMECDSIHSKIEQRMVSDIFTERDYVVIMESARMRPSPYHVKQMKHTDFMKLDSSFIQSIRPGKKTGDPTVHDLRGLRLQGNGEVEYKLSFSEEATWEVLPQRIQVVNDPKWIPMIQAKIPIKTRKYNDLQSMKHVMPAECHSFFDELPHE